MSGRQLELLELYSVLFICTSALAEETAVRLTLLGLAVIMGICIVCNTPKGE